MIRKVLPLTMALSLLLAMLAALTPTAMAGGDPEAAKYTKAAKAAATQGEVLTDKNLRILRTTNKAQLNQFVCEAFVIEHTNPMNIVNSFWDVVSREAGGCYSFANPDYKSGYIVAICPAYQLPTLRELAETLDRPGMNSAPGSAYTLYRMKHRNIANPQLVNSVLTYMGRSDLLFPDAEINSVMVYGAKGGHDVGLATLAELDKPLGQVEMKVKIYEMAAENDSQLGLDFEAWKNGPGKNLGIFSASGANVNANGIGNNQANARYSGVMLDYPSAFFDMLAAKGKAKYLSDSKIVAVNGMPARLNAMDRILSYIVSDSPNTPDRDMSVGQFTHSVTVPGGERVVGTITIPDGHPHGGQEMQLTVPVAPTTVQRSFESGVAVRITPLVGEETVSLDTSIEISSLIGYDSEGAPVINTQKREGVVALANGDEAVFGGLTREHIVENAEKVPFLGSLPILGYLFGGETSTVKKSSIVVSVQPTPIGEYSNATSQDNTIKVLVEGASEKTVQ